MLIDTNLNFKMCLLESAMVLTWELAPILYLPSLLLITTQLSPTQHTSCPIYKINLLIAIIPAPFHVHI